MVLIQSSLSFADRGNMTIETVASQELENEKSLSSSIFTPHYIILGIFGSAYILSFIVNLRVIYVVYNHLFERIRIRFSVRVLVGHLSLICIGITLLTVLNNCQSDYLIKIFGSRICEVSDFLKDSFICAYSLNIVLLVYERVRTISNFRSSLHIFRILGVVWSLAGTQGFFTMGLTYHMKAKLVEFKLGPQIAGIICETIRFLIFVLGVGISITYALVKVRSKLGQLPMPCQRLKSKIENICSFYLHFGTFIIIWITYGIWNAAVRCAFFLEYDLEPYAALMEYIELAFYTYLALNPMIHVLLLDNEMTACPNGYLCMKAHFRRDEHFEEETGILDDKYNTTVGVTSPGAIEEKEGDRMSGFCTIIRELSASPIKYGRHHNNPPPRIYIQRVYFVDKLDIEYIDADSEENASSDDGEYQLT